MNRLLMSSRSYIGTVVSEVSADHLAKPLGDEVKGRHFSCPCKVTVNREGMISGRSRRYFIALARQD